MPPASLNPYKSKALPQKELVDKGPVDRYNAPEVVERNGPAKRKMICGLKPALFWLVLALVLLVVLAAGLGGGLGGALASRNSGSSSVPQQTPSVAAEAAGSTSTAATTTTTNSPATTVTIPGPDITLYRDCPGTNGTIHAVRAGSVELQYRKYCGTMIAHADEKNLVSMAVSNFDDCIDMCGQFNGDSSLAPDKTCSGICWWNNQDTGSPGQCFGYAMKNNTAETLDTRSPICDGAILLNPQ